MLLSISGFCYKIKRSFYVITLSGTAFDRRFQHPIPHSADKTVKRKLDAGNEKSEIRKPRHSHAPAIRTSFLLLSRTSFDAKCPVWCFIANFLISISCAWFLRQSCSPLPLLHHLSDSNLSTDYWPTYCGKHRSRSNFATSVSVIHDQTSDPKSCT